MTLVNIYREAPLETVGPSRLLEETLDVVGLTRPDPLAPQRRWTVQGVYAPIPGRALGGLRFKLCDQKGFISFLNQRDFEVLYGVAKPGDYCVWTNTEYPAPGDRQWVGLCVDYEDLRDDLYEREAELRGSLPAGAILPYGLELERLIHDGPGNDYVETLCVSYDYDADGYGPDTSFDRVQHRWLSLDKTMRQSRKYLWQRS